MRKLIIAAVCAACGLAAAFTLTARATGPVTLPDLPGLGYSLSMQFNAQTGCGNYVVVSGNGVDHEILIGDLPPVCSTDAQEQARIDALLRDFPPPGAAPVTTTVHDTTTAYVTTQADPLPTVTVTTPADPAPTVTVIQPENHTVTETVTVVETIAQTAAPADAPLDPPWLLALGIRSQALNDAYGLT
jgi:hypothetical protein